MDRQNNFQLNLNVVNNKIKKMISKAKGDLLFDIYLLFTIIEMFRFSMEIPDPGNMYVLVYSHLHLFQLILLNTRPDQICINNYCLTLIPKLNTIGTL